MKKNARYASGHGTCYLRYSICTCLRIPCRDCDEVLPNKNALYKHRKKEHSDGSMQEQIDSGYTGNSLGGSPSGSGGGPPSVGGRAWACARCPRRFRARAELRNHVRTRHPQSIAVIEIHGVNPSTDEVINIINSNNISQDRVIEINLMTFLKGTTNIVPNCARALSMLSNVPKTRMHCPKTTHKNILSPLDELPPRLSGITASLRKPSFLLRSDNATHPQLLEGNAQNIQDLNVQILLQDGALANTNQMIQPDSVQF